MEFSVRLSGLVANLLWARLDPTGSLTFSTNKLSRVVSIRRGGSLTRTWGTASPRTRDLGTNSRNLFLAGSYELPSCVHLIFQCDLCVVLRVVVEKFAGSSFWWSETALRYLLNVSGNSSLFLVGGGGLPSDDGAGVVKHGKRTDPLASCFGNIALDGISSH